MPPSPSPADHPTRILTAGQNDHAPPLAGAATGNLPAPEQPAQQADRVARACWLVLVALGLLVPWFFNLRYFADGGSVLPEIFFRDAMANALTTAITLDVYLAAVAFSAWVLGERRVRWPWLVVVACCGVVVDHYENFPVASLLLPAKLRRPIEVIYRFARSADDIADEGDAEPAERLAGLAAYQAELDRIAAGQAPHTALFIALAEVIASTACRSSCSATCSTPLPRTWSSSATPTTRNCSITAAARPIQSAV